MDVLREVLTSEEFISLIGVSLSALITGFIIPALQENAKWQKLINDKEKVSKVKAVIRNGIRLANALNDASGETKKAWALDWVQQQEDVKEFIEELGFDYKKLADMLEDVYLDVKYTLHTEDEVALSDSDMYGE